MTFYNHIESLRGIAIDLTNGRKWRGASDKAAVFDALDAARREYMRLSDDNAKLREQIDAAHMSRLLTENENESLRELSARAWRLFREHGAVHESDLPEVDAVRDKMRELGVDE